MTNEEIAAARKLMEEDHGMAEESFQSGVAKTRHSLETKVGDSERKRNIEINAVLFLRLMEQLNGTFVWTDGPRNGDKFGNVFEALSTQMIGYSEKGLLDKGAHIEEHAPKLRSGFYAARKWLDKWFNLTVFLVAQDKESGIPTVITLDPDYELETGITAAQMQMHRDFKLADGQIIASTRRLVAATKQKDAVKGKLQDIMQHAIRELDDMRPQRS